MPFDCSQLPAAALKEEGPKVEKAAGECGGLPLEEAAEEKEREEAARVGGPPRGVKEEGARACAIMSDRPL